ncbi:hypothetical protein ADK43_38015 [Streptomyces rimosus subsp. rimosus]|nr:hypothetical protein ADK43_38015 [Streptomyces rimosus subsp. rimosus]
MTVAGAVTVAAAQAAPQPGNAAAQAGGAADDTPPFAVEDFAYPNAAKILQAKGLELGRGDGHILLSDCGDANIVVRTKEAVHDGFKYCFKATAKKGYLTLKVPQVFSLDSEGTAFQATITSEEKKQNVSVEKDGWKPVGTGDQRPGASGKPAVLIELRVNQ